MQGVSSVVGIHYYSRGPWVQTPWGVGGGNPVMVVPVLPLMPALNLCELSLVYTARSTQARTEIRPVSKKKILFQTSVIYLAYARHQVKNGARGESSPEIDNQKVRPAQAVCNRSPGRSHWSNCSGKEQPAKVSSKSTFGAKSSKSATKPSQMAPVRYRF